MLNNLFEIIEKKKDFFSIKLATAEHQVFQAHFPNNPLLPGFMMIEICSKTLNHEIVGIKKAKFITPVFPEDELAFFLKEKKEQISIKVQKQNKKVAELLYEKI